MTKQCLVCKEDKPISQETWKSGFYAKTRWPDGSIRRWQSECKECQREIQRFRKGMQRRGRPYEKRKPRMTPEEKREHRRRLYQEEMSDPVRRARRREQQRMAAALRRRRSGVPQRTTYKLHETSVEPLKTDLFVDPQPFLDWFSTLNGKTPTAMEMGDALSRQIRRIKSGEQEVMSIATVDEVGVLVGQPALVHALYPDMH